MAVTLVGVSGPVMVLSVKVSAELLLVMVVLGMERSCCLAPDTTGEPPISRLRLL